MQLDQKLKRLYFPVSILCQQGCRIIVLTAAIAMPKAKQPLSVFFYIMKPSVIGIGILAIILKMPSKLPQ